MEGLWALVFLMPACTALTRLHWLPSLCAWPALWLALALAAQLSRSPEYPVMGEILTVVCLVAAGISVVAWGAGRGVRTLVERRSA